MKAPSEAGFLAAVLALARLRGWRCLHLRPAMTRRGWRTALQGDGVGWPDVFAVRGGRLVAAELKSDRGVLTPDQDAWLRALMAAGVECHVWRPRDWKAVEETLR